jgi:hypothetical protein
LSTTNPTWTDPGSNPALRGERSATNRLSHGTANDVGLLQCQNFHKKFRDTGQRLKIPNVYTHRQYCKVTSLRSAF